MGKNLSHQDLIWVVPCVGGVDYPVDQPAEPMTVTIMNQVYDVQVQYHQLRNITYVLLDAPVFRQQTKAEPYPARMDDMTSAVYYSAWNQCIAQAITRFPIDLYHINDYHGTVAPLYLLPRTVPACLSLHNAEFQGLWPMRTKKERDEVSSVYNLPWPVVAEFVMFGEIFNLLHAGTRLMGNTSPSLRHLLTLLPRRIVFARLPARIRCCRRLQEVRKALLRTISNIMGSQESKSDRWVKSSPR